MPDPAALLAFLDAMHGDSIVLSLRQIGQIVGWAPDSGIWDTECCSGPEDSPTPILRALTLALEADWELVPFPNDAGITFTHRRPPLAPAPVDRAPRPGPLPSLLGAVVEKAEGRPNPLLPGRYPRPVRRSTREPASRAGATLH